MGGINFGWLQLPSFGWLDLLDISIIAIVIYKGISLIRNTRAIPLIKGMITIVVASVIGRWLGLTAVSWLLERIVTGILVALPVVFYPELRRALEQIGRGGFFRRPFTALEQEEVGKLVEELARAAEQLSSTRTGALMVIERETGLGEYVETGVRMDSVVSAELLQNIFVPNTPLHDGAVVIRGTRIMAAACFLPLSENPNLSKKMGARHRAALGVSEQSDAVALVVSEETGRIALAINGRLSRALDGHGLREGLMEIYHPATVFERLSNI